MLLSTSSTIQSTSVNLLAESLVLVVVDGVENTPRSQTVDDHLPSVRHQNITEHGTQVKSLVCIEQELKYKIHDDVDE